MDAGPSQQGHGRLFATGMRPQRGGRRGGGVAAYSFAFGWHLAKKLGGRETSYCVEPSFERAADSRPWADALAGTQRRVEGFE